ncbi:hypothetical protein M407DRAFT_176858 [Tulasnella calospora MUT 4182]|uniref:Uncharacterized protein n=1 Tax=Tulasnella calospora MUT 4182 TaxID=1051891 RepID=A0A0C3QD58_9AGAM|nr:hypothetical protein M407DRAFT_176858 [Tulasnella calospora MUT 4182]
MDGFHLVVAGPVDRAEASRSGLDRKKLPRCGASASFTDTHQDEEDMPCPSTKGSFERRTDKDFRAGLQGMRRPLASIPALPPCMQSLSRLTFYIFFIIFSIQANDAAALLNSFMPLWECHQNDPFDDPLDIRDMNIAHLSQSIFHSAESFLGHPLKIFVFLLLLLFLFVAIRIVTKYHFAPCFYACSRLLAGIACPCLDSNHPWLAAVST